MLHRLDILIHAFVFHRFIHDAVYVSDSGMCLSCWHYTSENCAEDPADTGFLMTRLKFQILACVCHAGTV